MLSPKKIIVFASPFQSISKWSLPRGLQVSLQTIRCEKVVIDNNWMLVCVYFKILLKFSIVFASTFQGISK
jgi:hypothetical protein